jgi:GntR family transcriptional regulator
MSMSPKYYQLYEKIRAQILNGQLQAHDQLPTEEELCARHDVSRGTVRKAFDALVTEGLIRREQGRGNFVNAPKPSLGAFVLADVPRPSHQMLDTHTVCLEVQIANSETAARLEIAMGAPVIYVAQVQRLNGTPILYEERTLAQALCPDLIHEDIDTQSLHWLLVHKYKLPLVRVTHTIEARTTSAQDARRLEMEQNEPIFAVDRLTYTTSEKTVKPAVWYRALCRGDYYQFKLEFLSSL